MADNIKIVGNINSISTVSRYSSEDTNLIQSSKVQENFGGENDYIEYYVYDIGGNLLNISYNYLNYKLPPNTGLTPGTTSPTNTTGNIQTENVGIVSTLATPTSSLYPIIEIDPIQDLQNLGYSSGEFKIQYNLFQNKISNYTNRELFIKEISQDRTEIRLASTTLPDITIESNVNSLIEEINTSIYYIDYLLNFGNNEQYVAVNVALNKAPDGYEILFKLYEPLPLSIQEKQTLWVVEEIVNPYLFDINLDKLITPPPPPQLRGANFDIDVPNQGTISTTYTNYSTALSSLQSLQNSSYSQILNLMNTQSIQINVDYAVTSSTSFNNFIFFSSAYKRTVNFYNKVKQIEDYTNLINNYTPYVATTASLRSEINLYSSSINTLVSQFDGYESYLYFESSSYAWPKSGSIKPYSLLSTGSSTIISWYNNLTSSAKTYDETNYDNLEYAVPTFIKDDGNNSQYLTFLNMVGHYFDNIWIYLKAVTDINLANNNLNKGISKDLVYNQLQSLGIKLYNSQAGEALDQFLIGANTGSTIWNNDFSITSSYLNNIPRKDLLSELYKRIYHNLPLLLKTKGTVSGLEYLISTFGISNQTYYTIISGSTQTTFYTPTGSFITSSILNVKEFGGSLKPNLIKGYNNDKVRIISNIITGSILSPLLSLQTYTTASSQFRENDSHYVDISFSPETQIDTYISGAIASNNPTWSLDDYIGDPRQQYNNSYSDLDTQRTLYFQTGVSGFAPFTGSLLDYNGFIRLIQFFDNALFKMLEDFVPERTSLSTGVTIASPVLERNKVSYANPTNSTTQSVQTAQYSIASISSSYGTFYDTLVTSNNTMGWFDGELSGSTVNVYQYFEDNYNPYLQPSNSIDQNAFAHSDWNVLLNNVSKSIQSNIRKKIEYTGNFLPTSSLTSSAELQDSYLSLRSYNTSRYEGSKLTSKLYNIYTTGSYTGSDGRTIQTGDKSYGKTAVIDRQSYKVAWVKNIPSQSLNFYDKTQIQLKYLVDKDLNITDLTLKNNNLFEVQNTFKSGDNVILSLSDAIKPSFQKTLDGTKSIFRGGYSYDPLLYRANNEVLNFRSFSPIGSNTSFAGIKKYAVDFLTGQNSGDSIFNNQDINTHNTGTSPSSIPVPNARYGWNYFVNYKGWLDQGGAPETNPMASSLTINQFQQTYPLYQTNPKTKYSHSPFNFVTNWSPGGGYVFTPEDTNAKNAYIFDQINFNTSSYLSGFDNEDIDTTDGGRFLYKAPRASNQYKVKLSVPIFLTAASFARLNNGTYTSWVYNFEGFTFKVFGVLESTTDPNPSSTTTWTYRGSTKIDSMPQCDSLISADNNNNTIHWSWKVTQGHEDSYNEQNLGPYYYKTGAILKLYDDTTNQEGLILNLAVGEILRFRVFLLDLDMFFTYGRDFKIEIGKPQLPPSSQVFTTTATGFNISTLNSIEPSYFQIEDQSVIKTVYNYDIQITGSNIFNLSSIGATGNIISFTPEMQSVLLTSSIFTPNSPTSINYSPVIDEFSLQPQDLIRVGSFSNLNPDYYTVVTSSTINTNQINTSAVFIPVQQLPTGQFSSVIQIQPSTENAQFFNNIYLTPTRQFTVSGVNGVTSPLTIYTLPAPVTISVNGTNGIVNLTVYQIPVSPIKTTAAQVIPTIPSIGVWSYSQLRRLGYILRGGVYTNFSGTPIYSTSVTLDRPITSPGQISQNFAILRPKPDETSVIINFRKSAGDVSQTILVPQDANDVIKASVGTIFQQLNVDLSNQNTNITQ
jgi:hypothetical protein